MITNQYKIALTTLMIFLTLISFGQSPSGIQNPDMEKMKIGRFYGKIIDDTGTGVPYATVSLYGMIPDTVNKTFSIGLIDGQITDNDGEFSLEKLPIIGEFTLNVSYLGFAEIEKKVDFGIIPDEEMREKMKNRVTRPTSGESSGSGFNPGMFSKLNFDIDLGNISLVEEAAVLDEVVVTGKKTNVMIALDKKTYRVDQDVNAKGGTAQDALKNVPSLTVDLDGNISLRNGSPKMYINGRPTTLSLDQIASDDIESVEVITNPSAKYEAEGGQSGIVNIVLKKNQKLGYNGVVMAGMDSQLGYNLGGNLNIREGDINIYLNGFANARRGEMFNETYRTNIFPDYQTTSFQNSITEGNGTFGNLRGGIDWFVSNRNTITFEGSYMRGMFGGPTTLDLSVDPFGGTDYTNVYRRISESERMFENIGASILYKHIYSKKGKELTADLSYNKISFGSEGSYETSYTNGQYGYQSQIGDGGTGIYTFQADYVDPISNTAKIEAGIRGSSRLVTNNNYNYVLNNENSMLQQIFSDADEYVFSDNVFGAYTTFSQTFPSWSYQVGLRAESSFYSGSLGNGDEYTNNYPVSLFPSAFVTKQLTESQNLQFSVSRSIKRPSFFQLIPFIDYSDSLNLRIGNPDLQPQFTTSVELSYQNILNDNHNILATLYYKNTDNLITSYLYTDIDPQTGNNVFYSSFANSDNAYAYGLELTMRNQIGRFIDFSTNLNLYNSMVDATNIDESLTNEQFSWFIKENITVSLPQNYRLQLSGRYQSKTAYSMSSGGRFGGFGGGMSTAQGYRAPFWFADFGISKSIMNNKGTISLNVQDVFGTRVNSSYNESDTFINETTRHRNFTVVRANFSYRFGKTDMSLFNRKNMNRNDAGSDMLGS